VDTGGQPGHPGPLAVRAAATPDLVRAYRGRVIKDTDQALLATFSTPGQAIRCAAAIRDAAAALGIEIASGIHTGEVGLTGDLVTGTSVHIADRVATLAKPAEILVSRTVKDLLAGSGVSFTARGSHQLTGTAGKWPLYAVTRQQ
jgi:class 3 adenylate cyclase